MTVEKGCQTW